MNNLAFLLSAKDGQHVEALQEIERAKKAFGPLPTLLDTEAQVCIAKGNPGRAEGLLNEVLALEPSATRYFHLAQAYQAAAKRLDAVVAWRQAQRLNLKPADLHPLERAGYQTMTREFAAEVRTN